MLETSTVVSSHNLKCPTASHWGAFMTLVVFHCCLHKWFCIFLDIELPLMIMIHVIIVVSLLHLGVVLYLTKEHIAIHRCGSVSLQFLDCQSMVSLYLIHLKYSTNAH